jgi:hypothetical protein
MYALGITNLRFEALRLLIGEGAACLLWAKCLQFGSGLNRPNSSHSIAPLFVSLFLGVIAAHGLAMLSHKIFGAGNFFFFMSVIVTMISALIVIARERTICAGQLT